MMTLMMRIMTEVMACYVVDDGNNNHDDYGNGHGHEDDGDGNSHKDSNDDVEGDINDHGDEDSDDIWSVREGPSMRHILLRETQRNCKLRGRAEDKTNKTQVYIQGLSLPAKCCHKYFTK